MRTFQIIVGIAVAFLIVSGFNAAYARGGDGPTNNNKRCQNVSGVWVDCSETNNEYTDKSVNNTNTNKNVNHNNSSANATATAGAKAQQLQLQGQTQSSKVDSVIVNDITIKDQRKTVQTIIDFNHISSPVGKTNADLTSGDETIAIKTMGVYPFISAIELSEAQRMGKDTRDYRVFDSTLAENNFRTRMLSEGIGDVIFGSVAFVPTGTAVTIDGLFGRAMEYGMRLGATHFSIMGVSKGVFHSGSKAGLDFGSSASVAVAADGSAVVAPGATAGFSTAWSSNEKRPGLMVMFSFDSSLSLQKVDTKGLDYSAGR